MIRLVTALCLLALAPLAHAQSGLPDPRRLSLPRPDKSMSCTEIETALAQLAPAATLERNRLQALYKSKGCLDQAFTRRLNNTIEFPAPDAADRAALRRRSMPADTTPPPDAPANAEGAKPPAPMP